MSPALRITGAERPLAGRNDGLGPSARRGVPRWPWPARFDAVVVGAVALLVYLLLGQRVLYGDGMFLLLAARAGHIGHAVHVAYLPLIVGAGRLLAPLGLSLHEVALLASQLGAAIGVGAIAAAVRTLTSSRRDAVLVAALVGGSASVLFFATVVELHGPFLAGVGLATWAAARLAMRPSVVAAVLAGLASALAFSLHAAGILLPLPLLGLAWAWPRSRVRRRPLLLVLAAALHLALVLGISMTLRAEGRPAPASSAVGLLEKWAPVVFADPGRIFDAIWCEWLWPFLPLGVLWPLAVRRAALRPLLAVTVVAFAGYMVATILVLGHANERGAYLHPMAVLFALLVVVGLGRRTAAVAAGIGFVLALGMVARHDSDRAQAYARGYAELRMGAPALLLCGDDRDVEACLVAMPQAPFELLFDTRWIDGPKPSADVARDLAALDAHIAAAWAHGEQVWASAAVLQWPDLPQGGIGATAHHLVDGYRLIPRKAAGFTGVQVLPRAGASSASFSRTR